MTTNQAASQPTTAGSPTAERRDWLRWAGVIISVVGLFVASYMSYVELANVQIACPGEATEIVPGVTVDCGLVQHSVYAQLAGIPVALLGLGGYLAILAVFLLEDRIPLLAQYGPLLNFGMALFGFLFSMYLTYIEFFVILVACTWCIASATLMTIVFVITIMRLYRVLRPTAA